MTPGTRQAKEEVSAGGIVYRRSSAGLRVLLIRDSYRNWGFPKGHLETDESPDAAALREVREETGLSRVELKAPLATIDWHFRFRGKVVHKTCHFFLIEAASARVRPLRKEGITACRWLAFERAAMLVSYENARMVLARAQAMLAEGGEA